MSRRDVQDVPLVPDGAGGDRAVGLDVRPARPEPAHRAVRPADPAVQGLRLDGDAALQLALLVLPEPRDGPGERLDERDLSEMGGRARRDDRDAGVLVSGSECAEVDDRSTGLRRRRQSRSDDDPGEESGEGESARVERLEFSATSGGTALRRRRSRRRRGRRDAAPIAQRLADGHGARPRGGERGAGPVCRLLRAVRDQPRGAGSRYRLSAGGPQRRPDAVRGGDARARRQPAAAVSRATGPEAKETHRAGVWGGAPR
jgi:hypothetical protein